ncbi:Bug family tripartite tricarboxylate transporter substrate binding protein [Xanthomonas axonopodis]|uniref:Bug family tripartite tricarboxylate transporter substrate binding protein n=1 Tax=Xanthomonas axonopodis TaxID=53413 RepID=UPI0035563B12
MKTMHRITKLLACLAISNAVNSAAAEANFPTKPVKLVVSYGAGGSLDVMARLLGTELAKVLGQPVVVENVAGASGTIGVKKVLGSAPDGYTLLLGITSEVALAPSTLPTAKYTSTDLQAVASVGTSGLVLVGNPKLKATNLAELIALSRSQPSGLHYGTSGAGSLQHLAIETLKQQADAHFVFVPYKSAAQVTTDVIGGTIDLAIVGLPAVQPFIANGKLKGFSVMSRQRDIGNQNIPSASELPALKDFNFTLWTGLFAPKGTPPEIVEKLHASTLQALEQPTLRQAYGEMGVAISPAMSSAEFSAYVSAEENNLKSAFDKSGIKIE